MKLFRRFTAVALVLLLFVSGCSSDKLSDVAAAPFTKVVWGASPDDVASSYGEALETYDSVYSGTTYTYNGTYQGESGTLKFMFDDKDALKSVAWMQTCSSADELDELYNSIKNEIEEDYGAPESVSGSGTYGDVWYPDDGDIVLSAWSTDELRAVQYAHLHPSVSGKNE